MNGTVRLRRPLEVNEHLTEMTNSHLQLQKVHQRHFQTNIPQRNSPTYNDYIHSREIGVHGVGFPRRARKYHAFI